MNDSENKEVIVDFGKLQPLQLVLNRTERFQRFRYFLKLSFDAAAWCHLKQSFYPIFLLSGAFSFD